jgi:Asp-tRNA(Asn)/Glu-tRNA(Gln) amidotransferase A subunit family amidase
VQLIGAPWREDLCLAAARTLEQAGIAEIRAPLYSGRR